MRKESLGKKKIKAITKRERGGERERERVVNERRIGYGLVSSTLPHCLSLHLFRKGDESDDSLFSFSFLIFFF